MTDDLPKPDTHCFDDDTGKDVWSYSADQLQAYAAAAVARERERCAKIADEHARRNYTWGSENSDIYHAQAHWAARIAKAIRHDPD